MLIVEQIPALPTRVADSHKGTYGRILLVAGCRGMSGAAVLCGTAALRGGAGLVQVAVPGEIAPIVAAGHPCYMTTGMNQDLRGRFASSAVDEIVALASWADVVAIGPGICQSETMPRLVQGVLERIDKPLVLDADALNTLAKIPAELWVDRENPLVLTPHPGEFARMSGHSADEIKARREELATAYATKHKVILVLKGHQTLVTDGERIYRNNTGNPGMATGGTGDVLTGLIAALIGQGLSCFDAAVLGVWTHGRAGDHAAKRLGQVSMLATDLLDALPQAIQEAGPAN